jgi:hypothetical protein
LIIGADSRLISFDPGLRSDGAYELGFVKFKQVSRLIEKKIAHPEVKGDLMCNKASFYKGFAGRTNWVNW